MDEELTKHGYKEEMDGKEGTQKCKGRPRKKN